MPLWEKCVCAHTRMYTHMHVYKYMDIEILFLKHIKYVTQIWNCEIIN